LEQTATNLISIHRTNKFTLAETNQLLPVIIKITNKYQDKLNRALTQIEQEGHLNTKAHLKIKAQNIIDEWNYKIKKLGAKPTGIWNADFDFGDGYYCWKYPEPKISHWHTHREGFSNRKPVQ